MSCANVRDTLLHCESPRLDDLPPLLVAHLKRCPGCMGLLNEIASLEQSWRQTALPPGAETSKAAFLAQLAAGVEPKVTTVAPTTRRPLWRSAAARSAIAASFLLVVLLGGWLLMPGSDAGAQEVMDKLVDWNLRIAESPEGQRPEAIAEQREKLQTLVRTAHLSDEDRVLAQSMLETGDFLAKNDDPLAAADRFDQIAEQLQERVDKADQKGDGRAVNAWARRFGSVSERGVRPQIDHSKKRPHDAKQRQRLETLVVNDVKRQEAIGHIAERHPDVQRMFGPKKSKGKKQPS